MKGPTREPRIRDIRGHAQARRKITGQPRRTGARLSWVGWRAGRYRTVISPKKVHPICVIASFFAGIPALLARSAAGFGLQTAPIALLREAFARWPPWSSPSKRSALRSATARDFGDRIAPGSRRFASRLKAACALSYGGTLRSSAKCP
jgi:hypothetical protein